MRQQSKTNSKTPDEHQIKQQKNVKQNNQTKMPKQNNSHSQFPVDSIDRLFDQSKAAFHYLRVTVALGHCLTQRKLCLIELK